MVNQKSNGYRRTTEKEFRQLVLDYIDNIQVGDEVFLRCGSDMTKSVVTEIYDPEDEGEKGYFKLADCPCEIDLLNGYSEDGHWQIMMPNPKTKKRYAMTQRAKYLVPRAVELIGDDVHASLNRVDRGDLQTIVDLLEANLG